MKRAVKRWGFVGGVLLAGAMVAVWRWHAVARERAIIAASVPPRPQATGLPAEFRERIDRCEQHARRGPDRLAALAELSRLYQANGFLAAASRCFEGLLRVDPDNPRWTHRFASILSGYGELHEALPLLRRTVALAPRYVPARLQLAKTLLDLNESAAASRAYAAVLRRQPDNPYAELGLARIEIAAGQWPQARDRLEIAVKKSCYRVGYDLLPTVYDHMGETEQADAIRARMKASGAFVDPYDPWLEELLDDCFDTYRLSMAAGTAVQRGDYKSAVHWVQRALKLAPDNGQLHFQLGIIYLEQKEDAKAVPELTRCTVLKPNFADAWAYLHQAYQSLGQPETAARVLAQGLAHCPDSPGLRLADARQLVAAGRYAAAIPEFEASIRLRPDEADAYVLLASDYFRLKEISRGVAELHRALEAEPENPTALSTLALYSISVGDEAAARKLMHQVRRQIRVGSTMLNRLNQAFERRFGIAP